MGSAIAQRLASKGYSLVLWNRSIEKATKLARDVGGIVVSSPREAAEACRSIHIVVSDDEASLEVLLGSNGVLSSSSIGVVVYNHSTVSPRHSVLMYRIALDKGIHYVETPIAGNPGNILNGNALVLCGATRREYCDARQLYELGDVVYLGHPPRASVAKLAFNISFLAIIGGLTEAFLLAEAYGLSYNELIEKVLSKTWLKVVLERYGERLQPGGKTSFPAKLAGKDARYAMEALQDKGFPGFVSAAIASYYSLMGALGGGDMDYPSMPGYLVEQLVGQVREREQGEDS
jgi:3-hydroxyisobutyrate dehydrogenase